MHDLGGRPGDEPVPRDEHPPHAFEERVMALVRLLGSPAKGIMGRDELRRGIESLNETEYAGYAYYERWVESVRRILVEKGVVDAAALEKRIEQVRARFAEAGADAPHGHRH